MRGPSLDAAAARQPRAGLRRLLPARQAARHATPSCLVALAAAWAVTAACWPASSPSGAAAVRGGGSSGTPHTTAAAGADADAAPSTAAAARGAAAALGAALLVVLLCKWRRNRARSAPPFAWAVLSEDLNTEFIIGGPWKDVVQKTGHYARRELVIPVNSKIEMRAGSVYRWALVVEQSSRERPEIQFGIQGCEFEKPWRLITTTRCSRAWDEEETWHKRPEGDKAIKEHDVVHLELDLTTRPGVLSMAINDEPFEVIFADIVADKPIMPAVMLAGDGGRVRVQATNRRSPQK